MICIIAIYINVLHMHGRSTSRTRVCPDKNTVSNNSVSSA